MKEYFKYANGYININDENLFLTQSGNWSETLTLQEKSSKSNFKASAKYLNYLIIVVLIGFGVYDVVKDFKNKTFPFGIVLLFLGFLAYIKREKGMRYKIPVAKIKSITLVHDAAKIKFYTTEGVEDCVEISKIEFKGFTILENLKSQILSPPIH